MSLSASLYLFWSALICGYAARRFRWLPGDFAPRCVQWMAAWVAPPVALLAMWVVDLRSVTLIGLPLLGVVVSFASLLPAWLLAPRLHLTGPRLGSWLVAAFFSNVGFLGALVAFTVWGEAAYGLCTLFFLCFSLLVYTIGYGIGDRYGTRPRDGRSSWELWRWAPMVGTITGLTLSWWQVPRPPVLAPLNHALIPVMTGTYLFMVGTTMRFHHVGRHVRDGLWMSAIKLLWAPAVCALCAWLLGYHRLMDGLPFRVAVFEAAMPSAITSVTLPALFGMDQDYANSLWVVTTLCSMLSIPLLLLLL